MSSKTARLESSEELRSRIRQAARYFPLAQLAVSTQCGFASSVIGNEIGEQAEFEKLRLVVKVAEEVWC